MADRRIVLVGDLVAAGVLAIGDGYRMRNEELGRSGVPFVRGGDISESGTIVHETEDRVREEFSPRLASKLTRPWDVAFITKGSVGRVGFMRPHQPPVVFAPQVAYWRSLDWTKLAPRFLYYLLKGPAFQASLDADKTHGSMVADYVSLSQQLDFKLELPPIDAQEAIGHVLGSLDDKIELNRQMNETLEAMARALFKSWFVDFDPVRAKIEGRAPFGMDAATAALFPDTVRGDVPHGWLPSTLGDVTANANGDIQTGPFGSQLHAKDYVEHGLPVIMPTNIRGRRVAAEDIVRITSEDAQRLSRHQLEVGDLVYSRRGDVEKHAIIGPEERGWLCGTGCLRVRPRRTHTMGPSPHYLSLWLDQPTSRAWIVARAVGATMPNLNTTILGELPVLLPPQPVIDAFDARITPLDDRARLARAESITLAQLRDLLLPKLLSGELRIRDAERAVEAVL